MAMNINESRYLGNLAKDPYHLGGEGDKTHVVITVAVGNNPYRNAAGDKVEPKPDYIDIHAWGSLAQNLLQYKHKGDQIYVEARTKQNIFERDGETVYNQDSVAYRVSYGANSNRDGQSNGTAAPVSDIPVDTTDFVPAGVASDDIPF